jgi:pre-mRNA-processing factor 19
LILFNKDSKQILATLNSHNKAISNVLFNSHHDSIISSSLDKKVIVWKFTTQTESYSPVSIYNDHSAAIPGLTLHPSGNFLVTGSQDKTWKFYDLEAAQSILSNETNSAITCSCFHPDGILLGFGDENNVISIWNVLTNKIVAQYEGHTQSVTSLSFSENGYHLASGSNDGTVKLWDLKNSRNFKTFEIGSNVNCVKFDESGNYLSAGSSAGSVHVYQNKVWEEISKQTEHKKSVTGVGFGKDAQFMASVSLDRNLKFYSGTLKK